MFKLEKLNLTQFASYEGVTRQTVYNWIKRGLPYEVTPSGRKVIDYPEYELWRNRTQKAEITDVQAGKIVNNLFDNGFWMAGYGHFNLTREEATHAVYLASKKYGNELESYYDALSIAKDI